MKFNFTLPSVFLIVPLVGIAGCSKTEPPTPKIADSITPETRRDTPQVEPAETPEPTALRDVNPDRHAAEWALEMGGAVVVDDGQQRQNVATQADLPTQQFQIRVMHLSKAKNLTNESLKELNAVRLQQLDLSEQPISDAGLQHIAGQIELGSLDLTGTNVTDEGIQHLNGLQKLNNLTLAHTQITGTGFQNIQNVPFTLINLDGCPVSDEALSHFSRMPSLRVLSLSNTRVSDKGLMDLRSPPKLHTLYLKGTSITDEGLNTLKNFSTLTTLHLHETKVTDKGIEELVKALPNLKIER